MKRIFKYLAAPIAFVAILAALAFNRNDAPKSEWVQDTDTGEWKEFFYAPPKPLQGHGGGRDTLTSSTGKTFQIPYIFASNYIGEVYCNVKKVSGTPNSKIVLDSRTITSGIWSPVDSVSIAGADSTKNHFRLRINPAYGSQYRIRLVKVGNSSLSTRIEYAFKPNQ